MLAAGSDGRKQCESVGIYSPDGEYLPLQAPVVTEGQPEEWLNSVEAAMYATTKAHLYKVLEDSKGECQPVQQHSWYACAHSFSLTRWAVLAFSLVT